MRYLIAFIWIIFLFSISVFAQAPTIQWTKTYGGSGIDEGRSVQKTSDGGYIISGDTYSFGAGSADIWLLKTDANGDTVWTRTIGGSGGEIGQSVQQTTGGGYIITGSTSSFGAVAEDIFLVRTDASGDTLWTKIFGGSDYDGGYSVQPTADGGYITVGRIYSAGNSRYDISITRTDSLGNIVDSKTYGGDGDDIANALQPTSDGGFIIAGVINSPGNGNDAWLAKTDAKGDTLWTKSYGGSSGDGANSVQQTSDDGYIIAGYTYSSGKGKNDVWLIKTDTNGDTLWTKTYGGSQGENAFCVRQTSDDGYIICGTTNSFGAGGVDIWLIRTDAAGDTLWTRTIGGSQGDYAYSVLQNADGSYVLTGEVSSDLVLIKIASDVMAIEKKPNTATDRFELQQNYPNPFNPATIISYQLSENSNVELVVYDVTGRVVKTLVRANQPAGSYKVPFDASALASGIYYYTLKTGTATLTHKMVLLR